MVWTIDINLDGSITFENGSLKMTGTKNKLDNDEKLLSVKQRLLTQLGEDNWHPFEGFNYEGLLKHFSTDDTIIYTKEELIKLNIISTLSQDEDIDPTIDRLEVTEISGTRTYEVELAFHLVQQTEILELTFNLNI